MNKKSGAGTVHDQVSCSIQSINEIFNRYSQNSFKQFQLTNTVSIWLTILVLSIVGFVGIGCNGSEKTATPRYTEYLGNEFLKLEEIREQKIKKVLHWLETQRQMIEKKETISRLNEYFESIRSLSAKYFNPKKFLEFNSDLEKFFVYELGSFYDLLFIDENGIVFYSVKMEDDFLTSFLHGPYAGTKLAQIIKSAPQSTIFVDFEYYGASDEPAAFYVFPIVFKNEHHGWIALQLSINHLNKLLSQRSDLGQTGEAYLVNERQFMLTESRFINSSTVLSKKIDTKAVMNQVGGSGSKIIDDYRGVKVLSTFRTFRFGSANWRIVVEKDESEVITNYYRRHAENIFPRLLQKIEAQTTDSLKSASSSFQFARQTKRVDVGELARTDKKKTIYTKGVATCTGVVGYMRQQDFAYMAHLSPLDDCYNLSEPAKAQLGDSTTDLIALMLRHISFFEIKPFQLNKVRFFVAAPHGDSLSHLITKMIDAGVSLSQLKVAISSRHNSVSLACDLSNQSVVAQWRKNFTQVTQKINFDAIPSIDQFLIKM